MSLLAEVLSSAEKVELEEINSKTNLVCKAVEDSKNKISTFLDNVYVRFSEFPKKNKSYSSDVNHLCNDIANLTNHINGITKKELTKSEHEMLGHVEALSRAKTALNLVGTLYTMHELLIDITELNSQKSFLACMKKIKEMGAFIHSLNPQESLPVLDEFKIMLVQEESVLLNVLSNTFYDCVVVESDDNKSIIKIKNEGDALQNTLAAFYFYKPVIAVLDSITRFLCNKIFTPVVTGSTKVTFDSVGDYQVLEIIIMDLEKKAPYDIVFDNLIQILNFLSAHFNVVLSKDFSTLNYMGKDLSENLYDLIIKGCLQYTIPTTQEGLENYKVVISATENLEKVLISSEMFVDNKTLSLSQYANNIEFLYINKKCENYLAQATVLMKKDLHDLTDVGTAENAESSLELKMGFSRCSVSRNIIELLQLLEKMLSEAITSSNICASRLFCTVEDICLKYIIFVPEHHKKLLQTIPQQIAVFYNNCIYIAHNLTEWTDTYLKKQCSDPCLSLSSYNDLGRQICEVASEMFTQYIDGQIKQIEEIMANANLNRRTLDNIDDTVEKYLRQCLRQQELLKTVWHKVLSYNIYNKSLGLILNSLCNFIVNTITKVEDISSDAAKGLVEMLKMVQTRGAKLFTDSKEVSLFVESWHRLTELIFVLNANLVDINDRWADGKGPLALQFKPEDLKQLIRALFQNTERRAALLAEIHN